MAECDSMAGMVGSDAVYQWTRKDQLCTPHDCCENDQKSFLTRWKQILEEVGAYAEAYVHRDEPVLLSGGSHILIRSEPD
jgi:hypothetical protein